MEKRELRMYFFIVRNLSGVSAGIQAGHCALEYAVKFGDDEQFKDFMSNWKTFILLNGGSSNDYRSWDGVAVGDLDKILDTLNSNGIKCAYFKEPDFNRALTAVCFIADERAFNFDKYPDRQYLSIEDFIDTQANDELWLESIGGPQNVVLRELIKGKRLY